MSVSILYYKVTPDKISSTQVSELINIWAAELPSQKQQQIAQLRQQEDQLLSLAGLQLLKLGMANFSDCPFSLDQLQFPQQRKPFFSDDIDFNISHSGNIACCAIADHIQIGIDLELQREVKSATMNKYLPQNAYSSQNSGKESQVEFFSIWTKNEAIIKAANHGSIYNMSEIALDSKGGKYQQHYWYTYPIKIESNNPKQAYTCHIASSEKLTDSALQVTQIFHL